MVSCGRDDIVRAIITLLEKEGQLTSREIIDGVEGVGGCSAPPTLIREVLAHLVRDGTVLKVPGRGERGNILMFQLRTSRSP